LGHGSFVSGAFRAAQRVGLDVHGDAIGKPDLNWDIPHVVGKMNAAVAFAEDGIKSCVCHD
jgi:hypothetical protein